MSRWRPLQPTFLFGVAVDARAERYALAAFATKHRRRATEHALVSLLAINGLRVSEALGADIEALGLERGHRTPDRESRGRQGYHHPARTTHSASHRPRYRRPDRGTDLPRPRQATARPVRRLADRSPARPQGRDQQAHRPHTLRHAFITAALNAGVPPETSRRQRAT